MIGRSLRGRSGDTSTLPLSLTDGAVELWRTAAGGGILVAAHCSAGRRRRIKAFRVVDSGAELYKGQRQCQSPSATSLGVVEDMCCCDDLGISDGHFEAACTGYFPGFDFIQLGRGESRRVYNHPISFLIRNSSTTFQWFDQAWSSNSSHKLSLMS